MCFIFQLCWVFIAVCGLSLVVVNSGCSLVWSTNSKVQVFVVLAYGFSCPVTCGIFQN